MALQLDTVLKEAVEHVCALPQAPEAVAVVRRGVRQVLEEWGLLDIAEDVLLVTSELVTNALLHALPPATLRLSRFRVDGRRTLRVDVTDTGSVGGPREPATEADADEHGRGLGIVAALSVRHGVRVDSDGITRWADLAAA
ncbi:ATP-binding protein [Streptomyces sp. NPDC052236]|uniref:ATP-binding protein n=1 Tax=Streptomyces sp. NPDC052236 TaxID=3365686 RepID=UPI0037CE57E4